MIPQPVDLNKLKGILGASKAIMKKVETGDFQTGHVDARALTEDGVAELQAEGVTRPVTSTPQQMGYNEETVMKSNLPPAIKKAMIEKPIPQLTNPSYTFSLDDVADLAEDKKMGLPRTPKSKVINESYNNQSGLITVSKEQLREMVNDLVNEKLLEFFVKNHNKNVTEDTVKRTVNTLIKEGRLQPKKKTI
jgi:hypothetical protein